MPKKMLDYDLESKADWSAPIPRDSALTMAGVQLFLTPQWTLLAKFDG